MSSSHSPQKKSSTKSSEFDHSYWEEYAKASITGGMAVRIVNGRKTLSNSYTQMFMRDCKLDAFLNFECKRILQLGASTAEFLTRKNDNGWKVIGYDAAVSATHTMEQKGIPCRLIDLNSVSHSKLSYEEKLQKDLSSPCNVLSIRILQYLSEQAATLLIFSLIANSTPGTTIFIVNMVANNAGCTMKKNYFASMFAPRQDIEFLKHELSCKDEKQAKLNGDHIDEIIVVKKLKSK